MRHAFNKKCRSLCAGQYWKKDILICNEKIELIEDKIEGLPGNCRVMDGEGLLLAPGMIDQHIHVTGGGGEGSFHTRTPELALSEMIKGGITTAVGLLGTDGITRSVENLYAKTAALNEEGVTAYMLTGAYGYPGPSITGEPDRDIMFVKEVLGMKLALSDHRAPNVTPGQLMQISGRVRVAGMLSGNREWSYCIWVMHRKGWNRSMKPLKIARFLSASSVRLM